MHTVCHYVLLTWQRALDMCHGNAGKARLSVRKPRPPFHLIQFHKYCGRRFVSDDDVIAAAAERALQARAPNPIHPTHFPLIDPPKVVQG